MVWSKPEENGTENLQESCRRAEVYSIRYWSFNLLQKAQDEHTIIAVAMDDIIITSRRKANVSKLKSEVRCFWEITDMRDILVSWIQDQEGQEPLNSFDQSASIYGIDGIQVKTYQHKTCYHTDATRSSAWGISNVHWWGKMTGIPYSKVIGSLLWAVMVSWPNVAFTVGVLSQFV